MASRPPWHATDPIHCDWLILKARAGAELARYQAAEHGLAASAATTETQLQQQIHLLVRDLAVSDTAALATLYRQAFLERLAELPPPTPLAAED